MSQALTLARPYARAAFAIANEERASAGWSDALGFAAQAAADPQVAGLLLNPRFGAEQATALLSPDAAGDSFKRFLALLASNRRLQQLPEIAALFEQLRADAERLVRAKVTSAQALPAAELESIKAALVKRFGRDVEIEADVDESLIGGAVIDADGMVIDGSLKGKLARLGAALAH